MSSNRGIFETFPNQPTGQRESPFAVIREPAEGAAPASSPFAPVNRQDSPFSVVDEPAEQPRPVEPGRPAKVPERRRQESPFQIAEPAEGFGFEAQTKPAQSPFEPTPGFGAAPAAASPFTPATPQAPPVSPFSMEPPRQAAAPAWSEPPSFPPPAAAPPQFQTAPPSAFAPQPAPPVTIPSAFAPQPVQQPAPQPAPSPVDQQSDSFSIRQLELRAIFGVDREMSAEEIIQRTRALPGMRNLARVGPREMETLESLKTLLPNLGFGSGALKLYSGAVPLEFIREGPVLLAVQTDGGFAPGVRETLMLVARELARLG